MKEYRVEFVQYHYYYVEANDEDEAFDNAYKEFQSDMRSSVANTIYDDYEIECLTEDDEDDE